MLNKLFIKINKPEISKNRISYRISYSKEISKYFLSDLFYVEYDCDIDKVSTSIQYIPIISAIMGIAWATGADIYVEQLDKTYVESLDLIGMIMKELYPRLPSEIKIHILKPVNDYVNDVNSRLGLLFSGGIDSICSFIRHIKEKPNLIMIWGVDVSLQEEKLWQKIQDEYKKYAEEEGVDINFVKTNMKENINEKLLKQEFEAYDLHYLFYELALYRIFLTGCIAPLTTVKRIGKLLIASDGISEELIRSSPERRLHIFSCNNIAWSSVKVAYDGRPLTRQEKIRMYLKPFLNGNKHNIPLKVCFYLRKDIHDFNCGKCEKCMRTIVGLLLENIDPTNLGFKIKIDDKYYNYVKMFLTRSKFSDKIINDYWRQIQYSIPEKLEYNLYGSKYFFKWLKNFNLKAPKQIHLIRECSKVIRKYIPNNIKQKLARKRNTKEFIIFKVLNNPFRK